MKQTKRILCLLLALLMLLPLTVACQKKSDDGANVDGTESGDVAGDAGTAAPSGDGSGETGEQIETDEQGFQKDKLDGLDFEGKELKILGCSDPIMKELNISAEEMNNNEVNRALYTRDMKVKARLNVKPVYTLATRDELLSEAEMLSTTGGVDIYVPYSRLSASLMMQGYTRNLLDVNYLDFSAPWWTQDLLNKVTIHGKMYVASGPISPSLIAQTFFIGFNKTMFDEVKGDKLAEYDAESLYEMVEEGTWTIDAMLEIAKGVGFGTEDGKDRSDKYGFTADPINLDGFYQGAGLKVLDYNPDGSISVSEDLYSPQAHALVEKLTDFFDTPDAAVGNTYSHAYSTWVFPAFQEGNVLFHANTTIYARIAVNGGLNLGILPMPKYDTDQDRYYSIAGFAYLVWSISRDAVESLDACGAFMECMASESYRTTAVTMYEDYFRGQASSDADDYKMWETIVQTMEVEGGRLFVDIFKDQSYYIFRKAVMTRSDDYMSDASSMRQTMNGYADGLNNLMKTLEDIYGNK